MTLEERKARFDAWFESYDEEDDDDLECAENPTGHWQRGLVRYLADRPGSPTVDGAARFFGWNTGPATLPDSYTVPRPSCIAARDEIELAAHCLARKGLLRREGDDLALTGTGILRARDL